MDDLIAGILSRQPELTQGLGPKRGSEMVPRRLTADKNGNLAVREDPQRLASEN